MGAVARSCEKTSEHIQCLSTAGAKKFRFLPLRWWIAMKTTFQAAATATRIFCLPRLVFASSDLSPSFYLSIYLSLSLFLPIRHSRGDIRCLLSSLVELELKIYAWSLLGDLSPFDCVYSFCPYFFLGFVFMVVWYTGSGLSYPSYPIRNNFAWFSH